MSTPTPTPPVRSRSLASSPRKRPILPFRDPEEVRRTLDRTLTQAEDSPRKQYSPVKHVSNKVPGYAFFFFGSPRFECSETLPGKGKSDYSPLHLPQSESMRRAGLELFEDHRDLTQYTVSAKLRKLKTMSRIRNRRIRTAQESKRQQLQETKHWRVELLERKQERFDFRMRRSEIRCVGGAWLTVLAGYTAVRVCMGLLAFRTVSSMQALKAKTRLFLKTFVQVAYCLWRLQRIARRIREKRAYQVSTTQAIERIRPYVHSWLTRRRTAAQFKVLQCIERALAEARLRSIMLNWLEAVRTSQILTIQRAFRQLRIELQRADAAIVKLWTRWESREGGTPVEYLFKLAFLRVYRRYMRRQLRFQAQERSQLEASVFSSAVAHQISSKTATELIQAQSPRLAAALIARPALKQLSEVQVAELRKSCGVWLGHVQACGEQELTVEALEMLLVKEKAGRKRSSSSKSPRNKRLCKARSLK